MPELIPGRQFSAASAARALLTSPVKLAVGAALCMLLFLFMPAVYISSSVMGFATGGITVSGTELAGWAAWFSFFAFSAAAASRFSTPLGPYKKLLDLLAFGMAAVALFYAVFGGPVASTLHQVNEMTSQVGGLLGGAARGFAPTSTPQIGSVSIIPHIGVILFLLAPAALLQAKRRENAVALSSDALNFHAS